MESVQRITVRDRAPILDPRALRAGGAAVAAVGAAALLVQVLALVQVGQGLGDRVGSFEHLEFAAVAALWLMLGGAVFFQRGGDVAGRYFALSAATGSCYLALGTLSGTNAPDAALYSVGALLFPPCLYQFTRMFVGLRPPRRRDALVFVPSLALAVPMARDFVSGTHSAMWRAALALVAVFLMASIVQIWRDLKHAQTPNQAAQGRALAFGLVSGTVPGVALVLAPLATTGTAPVAITWQPNFILLFLLAMSVAALLSELADAHAVVRRGVVYGLITCAIVAAYAFLGGALAAGRTSVTSPGGGLSFVAVSIAVGAAFGPIRTGARRLVDWILYGRVLDRWALLQELTGRLERVMRAEDLERVLVHGVARALHLRGAMLLRLDGSGGFVTAVSAGRWAGFPDTPIPADVLAAALGDPPRPALLIHGRPLTPARYRPVPEHLAVLDHLGSAFTVPLVTRDGLIAVLCLGPKISHDAFDGDDVALLAPLVQQASAALDNALLFARLQESVDELRLAYGRIAREQEAERSRLARELHDGTAQEIAGILTLTSVVERQMAPGEQAARGTLHRLRSQAQAAYDGVRRASHGLHPAMLDDFGLAPTLQRYLQEFEAVTGITVDYVAEPLPRLAPDVELALFRVAQECVENARKHSGTTHVDVRVRCDEGHVVLAVRDGGRGMPGRFSGGIGVTGMRERLQSVGGSLLIESPLQGGVVVQARAPLAMEMACPP